VRLRLVQDDFRELDLPASTGVFQFMEDIGGLFPANRANIEVAHGHRVEERASFRSTLLAQLILNLVTVEAILLEGLFQEMGDLF
jgi:hypothetical protein